MRKTMYEKYRDNELPQDLMERIKSRQNQAETQSEKDFIAGFWVKMNIDKCLDTPSPKKVYISGQITGLEESEYKKLFNTTEDVLLSFGYDPVNPIALDEAEATKDWTWHDYMKRDIKLLCGCDYIYLLPNWKNSKGAKFEYMIADMLQIPCLNLQDIQEVTE